MKSFIQIHPADDVAVALQDLAAGTTLFVPGDTEITLQNDIPKGHKFAVRPISSGEPLKKYGAIFAEATRDLQSGEWVNEQSVKTRLNDILSYQYQPNLSNAVKKEPTEVQVYRRPNGDVGIRNELWIIPSVACVNGIAENLAKIFLRQHGCHDIDGVHVFPHQFGCSQLGEDLQGTRNILRCMMMHPNAGGVLVLGLGCESNQVAELIAGVDQPRLKHLITQTVDDEMEAGLAALEDLYQQMRGDRRESGRLDELRFGLECGGSDGLSGITANPLLGAFSDEIVAQGGTTVLTEVPEMFGAEFLLMERCRSAAVFQQLVAMINEFKQYYKDHNQPIYENPSPGNKAGGISTLEEKSLGCTQKAGTAVVEAVVDYGQRLQTKGLNLLNSPGNDAIATSALAASGCHLVLFTTGRGTPYGGFVPTVKIATNTDLATRKKHWIDFNAGCLLEGEEMQEVVARFIDQLVRIVNGEYTKNEQYGFRELAIWKRGVTL